MRGRGARAVQRGRRARCSATAARTVLFRENAHEQAAGVKTRTARVMKGAVNISARPPAHVRVFGKGP